MKLLCIICLVILALTTSSLASPFLERLYNPNSYNVNPFGSGRSIQTTRRARTTKQRGRSFKEICRAINPAPYAFPNKIPYPSVPIC